MSECKALCEAGCSEACNVKASAGAASACEPAGYAPVDRQAGCPNIDSDPPPKNFPRRSCFNKTYAAGYWVAEKRVCRWEVVLVQKWIPHVMTTDCRYDRMASDPECVGCKWRKVN